MVVIVSVEEESFSQDFKKCLISCSKVKTAIPKIESCLSKRQQGRVAMYLGSSGVWRKHPYAKTPNIENAPLFNMTGNGHIRPSVPYRYGPMLLLL